MIQSKIFNLFWRALPLAVIITLMSAATTLAVQQDLRQNANDPQIQIVEDISHAIDAGDTADSISQQLGALDISQTLSPFVIIYDTTGKPMNSQVTLDGSTPTPPSGVFDATKKLGEDRFTWQPKAGDRFATVVIAVDGGKNGFVLAGRSLTEVEKRERQLYYEMGAAFLATLLLVLLWLGVDIWLFPASVPKVEKVDIIS